MGQGRWDQEKKEGEEEKEAAEDVPATLGVALTPGVLLPSVRLPVDALISG